MTAATCIEESISRGMEGLLHQGSILSHIYSRGGMEPVSRRDRKGRGTLDQACREHTKAAAIFVNRGGQKRIEIMGREKSLSTRVCDTSRWGRKKRDGLGGG